MLTLLHTADWHLGQQFFGFDRDWEHARFLDWLVGEIRRQQADVLLVSGDVFDSVNPPAQAQRRFFEFLAAAGQAQPGLQVVVIAGNHDSGARLEAPGALLESLRITIVGTIQRQPDGSPDVSRLLVPLTDRTGHVLAIAVAVPFLRASDVPQVPDAADPLMSGIREVYRLATAAAAELRDSRFPDAALIALGHCHIQGGEESADSERRLVAGGSESLPASSFPPELSYVALGHLHRPQQVEEGRIVYSGSPFPLSFPERTCQHRIMRIVCDQKGRTRSHSLLIPRPVPVLRIPEGPAQPQEVVLQVLKDFDVTHSAADVPATRLSDHGSEMPESWWPFVEVVLQPSGPDPDRRSRIERALQNKPLRLASIRLEAGETAANATAKTPDPVSLADLRSLDPERILRDVHESRYQCPPDQDVIAAFREVLALEAVQE